MASLAICVCMAWRVGARCVCENSCLFAFDRHCDDGGAGHQDRSCKLGTDCADCGPRCAIKPTTPVPTTKRNWTPGMRQTRQSFAQEKAFFDQQIAVKKRLRAAAKARCDLRCPGGRFRDHHGGVCKCSACPPGKYRVDDKMHLPCVKCPKGKFASVRVSRLGAAKCALCPRGKMSFHYRDELARPITPTAVGTFSCTKCAPGSFSSILGASTCTECSEGQFTAVAAQRKCTLCVAGQLQQFRGRRKCTKCPSGQWTDAMAARHCRPCRSCVHGQYRYSCGGSKPGLCLDCPLGRAKSSAGHWSTLCHKCAYGSFQTLEGQQTCRQCTNGHFSSVEGADACTPCQSCAAGTFRSECGTSSAGFCTPCAAGKFKGAVSSAPCKPCGRGRFSANTGALRCALCPGGKFQLGNGLHSCVLCTACVLGLYRTGCSARSSGTCLRCPPGKFGGGGATGGSPCVLCSSGQYTQDVGASKCDKCPSGRLSLPSGTACTATATCPPDTHEVSNIWGEATGCATCAAGRHATAEVYSANPCTACPPDTFSFSGAKHCTPCSRRVCPRGTISVGCGSGGLSGSCALPKRVVPAPTPTSVRKSKGSVESSQLTVLRGACCDPMWHATSTMKCSKASGKMRVKYMPPYTLAEVKQHSCKLVPGGGCRCCRCDQPA